MTLKKGMKVKCISDRFTNITMNKIYTITKISKTQFFVKVDNGAQLMYNFNELDFKIVKKWIKPKSEVEWLNRVQKNFQIKEEDIDNDF